jgi:hypothetical protein
MQYQQANKTLWYSTKPDIMIDRLLLQTIQTPCHPCVTPAKAVVSLSKHRLRGNDKRYLLHLIDHGGECRT